MYATASGAGATLDQSHTERRDRMPASTGRMLDYTYRDVFDPPPQTHEFPTYSPARFSMEIEPVPEMIGTTADIQEEIILGREPKFIELRLREPADRQLFTAQHTIDREVYLYIENITATTRPINSYLVYINLPPGVNPNQYPDLKAGIIPAFGIIEASRTSEGQERTGINYSFDITDIVSFLELHGLWNPERLRVTFVPYSAEAEEEAVRNTGSVNIGRVSLYYL